MEEEGEESLPNGVSGLAGQEAYNMSWGFHLTTVSSNGHSLHNPNLLTLYESSQVPKQSVLRPSICQRYPLDEGSYMF